MWSAFGWFVGSSRLSWRLSRNWHAWACTRFDLMMAGLDVKYRNRPTRTLMKFGSNSMVMVLMRTYAVGDTGYMLVNSGRFAVLPH